MEDRTRGRRGEAEGAEEMKKKKKQFSQDMMMIMVLVTIGNLKESVNNNTLQSN